MSCTYTHRQIHKPLLVVQHSSQPSAVGQFQLGSAAVGNTAAPGVFPPLSSSSPPAARPAVLVVPVPSSTAGEEEKTDSVMWIVDYLTVFFPKLLTELKLEYGFGLYLFSLIHSFHSSNNNHATPGAVR